MWWKAQSTQSTIGRTDASLTYLKPHIPEVEIIKPFKMLPHLSGWKDSTSLAGSAWAGTWYMGRFHGRETPHNKITSTDHVPAPILDKPALGIV